MNVFSKTYMFSLVPLIAVGMYILPEVLQIMKMLHKQDVDVCVVYFQHMCLHEVIHNIKCVQVVRESL